MLDRYQRNAMFYLAENVFFSGHWLRVQYLGDVLLMSKKEIMKRKNVGKTTMAHIISLIRETTGAEPGELGEEDKKAFLAAREHGGRWPRWYAKQRQR